MNRIVAPALIAIALALPAAAETRNLSGFQNIAAQDGVRVDVSIGQRFAVEVTGHDAARVRTEVRDGTLRIARMSRPWFNFGPDHFDGRVRIVMPSLESISSASGAELTATGLQGNDLTVSAAMGGTVDVAGTCNALSASVAMGGELNAKNLHCDEADISASMGGQADVFATRTYAASASMGGEVNVSGQAARGDVSTSFGGSVSQD